MLDLSFFTTLQIGWFNAWIPAFGMVLIQFVYMALFPEMGKRAVDTSWYTSSDRLWASVSSCLQIALLVLSVFVPFKFGTAWFVTGGAIFVLSLAAFIWAFHSYGIDQRERPSKAVFIVGRATPCISSFSRQCWVQALPAPRFGCSSSLFPLALRCISPSLAKSVIANRHTEKNI